jgi:Trk-type K+ transport system membrane component
MLLIFAHSLLGKWVLAALMLMGRLGFYTVIVPLSPGAWRK